MLAGGAHYRSPVNYLKYLFQINLLSGVSQKMKISLVTPLTLLALLVFGLCSCSFSDDYSTKVTVYEKLPGANLHVPVDRVKIEYTGKTTYTNARGEALIEGEYGAGGTMTLSKDGFKSLKLEISGLNRESVIIGRIQN